MARMVDPGLQELIELGSPDDVVSVILRLEEGKAPPPTVRIVSQFGEIYTARVRRGDITETRESPGVISLKSSDIVTLPPPLDEAMYADVEDELDVEEPGEDLGDGELDWTEQSVRATAANPIPGADGRGVVVGICDWGFDFTHANFRNPDGSTRLLSLWDQRGGPGHRLAPKPYDYGRLLTQATINAALAQPDPPKALGYHPASGDPTNTGAHGTHVADILCGNRREPGSKVGLASRSDIVFVHLAPPHLTEVDNLGDACGLMEGLDFIRRQAAGRPCVLHLSAGKTGGPHRGNTLLERAVDAMLRDTGIVLVQSVGNYADASMHTHARIGPDQRHVFDWVTPANDRTPNELEIWYSGHDVLDVTLVAPDGREFSAALDQRLRLVDGTRQWGNLYHRKHEPNSGMNHIVIFLYTKAPSGRWRVVLHGRDVVDGRLHAWIERDASGRYQSRFPRSQASSRFTTNTICNSFLAIAVGAYDATRPDRTPTRFSSRGPTADGRQKPELAAPGYRVRAARSMPSGGWTPGDPKLTVKSGTSMAAPWVSGTVALMMGVAGRPLTIHEIRRTLVGTADPHAGPSGRSSTRLGYGYLNTAAAVDAARKLGQTPISRAPTILPLEVGEVAPLEAAESVEAVEALETRESVEPEGYGYPPIFVEDAVTNIELDEVWPIEQASTLETAPLETAVATPVVRMGAAEAAAAASVHEHTEGCGCGCCGHGAAPSRAQEIDDREDVSEVDEWDEDAAIEDAGIADAGIETPFEWEDVRAAVEAVAESDR